MKTPPNRAAVAAVLAGAGFLALSACSTPSEDNSSADSGKSDEIKSLQFVNPLPNTAVWKQIGSCIGDEAKAKGITKYTQSGPPASSPGDPTVMIQQIQTAVAGKTDAIITFPSSGAFGPVLQKAQKSGTLTATLYGDGKPESGATVNAGVDWGVIGTKYVDAIAALPGDHVVGLVAEGPTGIGKYWTDGVKAAAAKTDNVKIAATVYVGADTAKALPQVASLLTAHSDIDIVASNTGVMTQGGVAAIKAKGLEGKVKLLVINNANGGPEAVADGMAIGVYLQDSCDLGKRTVDGLVEAATGKDVPLVQVKDVIATKDNVQDYIDKGWN